MFGRSKLKKLDEWKKIKEHAMKNIKEEFKFNAEIVAGIDKMIERERDLIKESTERIHEFESVLSEINIEIKKAEESDEI